jgi:hypothetical protein
MIDFMPFEDFWLKVGIAEIPGDESGAQAEIRCEQ